MSEGSVTWFGFWTDFRFIQPNGVQEDVCAHIATVEHAGLQGSQRGSEVSRVLSADNTARPPRQV